MARNGSSRGADEGRRGALSRKARQCLEIVKEAEALRAGPWLLPAPGREGHVTPSGRIQALQ